MAAPWVALYLVYVIASSQRIDPSSVYADSTVPYSISTQQDHFAVTKFNSFILVLSTVDSSEDFRDFGAKFI